MINHTGERLFREKFEDLGSSEYVRVLCSLIFFEAVTFTMYRGYDPIDECDEVLWRMLRSEGDSVIKASERLKSEPLIALAIKIARNMGVRDDAKRLYLFNNARTTNLVLSTLDCLEESPEPEVMRGILQREVIDTIPKFFSEFALWKLRGSKITLDETIVQQLVTEITLQRAVYVAFELMYLSKPFSFALLSQFRNRNGAFTLSSSEAKTRGLSHDMSWKQCFF